MNYDGLGEIRESARERERGATFFFLLSSCWAISELQQPTNHSDAELKPKSLSCSRKVFGLACVWKCTVVTFSWLSFFCEKFSPSTNYWCWWLRTKVSLLLLLISVHLCVWTPLAAAAEVIEAVQRCCFEPKSTKFGVSRHRMSEVINKVCCSTKKRLFHFY